MSTDSQMGQEKKGINLWKSYLYRQYQYVQEYQRLQCNRFLANNNRLINCVNQLTVSTHTKNRNAISLGVFVVESTDAIRSHEANIPEIARYLSDFLTAAGDGGVAKTTELRL